MWAGETGNADPRSCCGDMREAREGAGLEAQAAFHSEVAQTKIINTDLKALGAVTDSSGCQSLNPAEGKGKSCLWLQQCQRGDRSWAVPFLAVFGSLCFPSVSSKTL